jgi:hypothetical protein
LGTRLSPIPSMTMASESGSRISVKKLLCIVEISSYSGLTLIIYSVL